MFSDLCFGITYSEHIAYMYIVHICNVFWISDDAKTYH